MILVVTLVTPMVIVGGVAAAWLKLWLGGLQVPSIAWVDRLGLTLGWYWIISAPLAFWSLLEYL